MISLPGRWSFLQKDSFLLTTGLLLVMGCTLLLYFTFQSTLILFFPLLISALVLGLQNFRTLYLLIWATIPFAVEIDLPGGFSTDFPAEPLMWLSCFALLGYLSVNLRQIDFRFVFHPIWILLFLHLSWIIITTITSDYFLISAKYTLAKTWYLVCFVLIPLLLFKRTEDFRQWGYYLFVPLMTTVVIILLRHAMHGFSFAKINEAIMPLYRNHVDYACCLAILLPFVWWMWRSVASTWGRFFFLVSIGLMIVGIYFSYTRAAWVCIPLAIGSYFLIRLKWLRTLIPVFVACVILLVGWLTYENKYLEFSPNYEKAVTHQRFDDLISATYKMEDISTVERFYRWVAGYYMVLDKPVLGFGPATFYNSYDTYVDRHFTTYVSDNPEKSGIHNYYLMTAAEQGIPGLIIFLMLVFLVLWRGESLYHRMSAGADRRLLIAALMSLLCSLFVLTLNDTVETDKLGTFFFLSISIVLYLDMKHRVA